MKNIVLRIATMLILGGIVFFVLFFSQDSIVSIFSIFNRFFESKSIEVPASIEFLSPSQYEGKDVDVLRMPYYRVPIPTSAYVVKQEEEQNVDVLSSPDYRLPIPKSAYVVKQEAKQESPTKKKVGVGYKITDTLSAEGELEIRSKEIQQREAEDSVVLKYKKVF